MKGKFIKKLTAYALTVAMVAATPMTAFASEFADNFWVSDGVTENDPSSSGTGTVSSTNTNTTVLGYASNVTGIVIKEQGAANAASSIVMDLNESKTKTLVAEVQYDGAELTETQRKEMNKKITWRSSNLEIIRPAARYDSREICPVTAYKGGFAAITAGLDIDNDGTADFTARVMVMVKKTPTDIHLNIPNNNTLYAGHTYDLMDYVTFGAADEFDAVEFAFDVTATKAAKTKLVTTGKDGLLKLDKSIKDTDKLEVTVTATVTGTNLSDTAVITLSEGVPVTGLKFEGTAENKKPTYDIADNYEKSGDTWKLKSTKQNKSVTVTVKTKSGKDTTDDITWSSSDSRIVKVTSNVVSTEKNDGKPFNTVTFEGLSVGKATITATSTSGKSAKVTVTVTATLLDITSVSVKGNTTYSGKATPLVINRIPAQNNDKLKIAVTDKNEKKIVKVKAGITPVITPVADLVTKLNADGQEIKTVTVTQAKAAKGKTAISKTVTSFTVKQSDVLLDKIVSGADRLTDMNKKTVKMNSNRIVTYFATLDPNHDNVPGTEAVSWTSSKETVATVDNGRIAVVGDGTAKITVSSVYKNAKGKYATIKKTFTIKSTPMCEAIILKSGLVTVKQGKDAVINIKQQSPSKAADTVTWYTYNQSTGEMKAVPKDKKTTDKKCTISTSGYQAGDVITVVAMAGSAQVQAKIVVTAAK